LNARQDQEEADIIARAGEAGRITVATNMAGRGNHIPPAPGVAQGGGVHGLSTERPAGRRIRRPPFRRGGRQGDPGSYEAFVSLDDEIAIVYAGRPQRWLAILAARTLGRPGNWLAALTIRRAQRAAEGLHSRVRRDLVRYDEQLETALAFAGRPE